jgi:hypothetical protein
MNNPYTERQKINNICCILEPYSQCWNCDGVVCKECDVWITEECPSGDEIGDRHYLRGIIPYEQTVLQRQSLLSL